MVEHIQENRRLLANELFECVWPLWDWNFTVNKSLTYMFNL